MINMLQRIAGYSLTGDVSEQCLFFFYGDGSNGKSTFLSTLQKILGDYAQPAPRGLLESDRNNDHDTRLAYLYRARLVVCSEVESGKHIAEALVKDLTGGERISARRMREDPWSFDPTAKIIVAGNHKPIVAGQDHGFWRRMKLIPWTITITEEQKDLELLKKLEAEYKGILNWAVMGCVAWKTDGSKLRTDLIEKFVTEYKEEQLNDQAANQMLPAEVLKDLTEFAISRLEFGQDFRVEKNKLSMEYRDWCDENEKLSISQTKLYSFLRTNGVVDKEKKAPVKIKNEKGWIPAFKGIKIKMKST
jgi:putative DNA primase/helicase